MKEYKMLQEEMDEIVRINKEGGDPVMCISGGVPLGQSLQGKINDYWKKLGIKYGFDPMTVCPSSTSNLHFNADPIKE